MYRMCGEGLGGDKTADASGSIRRPERELERQYDAARRELTTLAARYRRSRTDWNWRTYCAQWAYCAILWDRMRKCRTM